jgi:hypothetical protein
VKTAVWCYLDLAHKLVGLPDVEPALSQLKPSALRRSAIRRFVSASAILADDDLLGEAMQNNLMGYLFLLLLIDRPVDAIKLFGRALWPTRAWLEARYGDGASHWQHIGYLLRRRRI